MFELYLFLNILILYTVYSYGQDPLNLDQVKTKTSVQ